MGLIADLQTGPHGVCGIPSGSPLLHLAPLGRSGQTQDKPVGKDKGKVIKQILIQKKDKPSTFKHWDYGRKSCLSFSLNLKFKVIHITLTFLNLSSLKNDAKA